MISSLQLKFGSAQNTGPLAVDVTPITIFVGPNNSGKSKVLNEIELYCRTGQRQQNWLILDSMKLRAIVQDDFDAAIKSILKPANPGEAQAVDHIFVGSKYGRRQLNLASMKKILAAPEENMEAFCQQFLMHRTLKLDGPSRIGLVVQQAAGDLQAPPHKHSQHCFSTMLSESKCVGSCTKPLVPIS
jgi:hypothetical protein